jgi:membrane protein implicated in regulation of membrane protease activity
MQIVDLIASYGPWAWIVAGAVLLGLELAVPGGILLWLGISAIITGLASMFQPGLPWPVLFLIFGGLSLVTIIGWLRWSKGRGEEATDSPFLNRRADRFIGKEAVLSEPILNGSGRVALDDSVWRIAGPDLGAGQRIRIVGHDGAVLKVEAA